MDDDWEKIADNPKLSKIATENVNKWAGEDEEDPKDSWEDALEDEKRDEEKVEITVKAKKSAQQRISEKEKAKKEQTEKLKKEQDDEDTANLTPEEKLRLQKLQEEEYTKAALDTLGLTSNVSIDSFNPKTKEEFAEFGDVLCKKISHFKARDEYVSFLDDFVRNLLAGLSSVNIRKVKTTLDNLYLEKQKMEKGDKQKKKTGGAGKVRTKLRVEDDDDYASRANYGSGAFEDDDYEDFM